MPSCPSSEADERGLPPDCRESAPHLFFYPEGVPHREPMRAYVLVKVRTGREKGVMESLQEIAAIREIHFLFGEYDYLLSLDVPDTTALARLVSMRIRKVPGIEQTATLVEAPI